MVSRIIFRAEQNRGWHGLAPVQYNPVLRKSRLLRERA
jgi:hypothetical protein